MTQALRYVNKSAAAVNKSASAEISSLPAPGYSHVAFTVLI